MNKVKCALVGAGVIGKRHLLALQDVDDIDLVAIVDPQSASSDIAQQHHVPHFLDCSSMLAKCQPDGVVVATPTEHHLEPTLASLDAGAHVLVEKPIMATPEEAEQVIAHSKKCKRHVLVGHQRRYYAQVQQCKELIQSGELGQLVAVSGQWNMRKPDDYYAADWRKRWQAGPILTNLIHEIDYLRYICGDIESVMAETANSVQGFEKEDVAALILRFKSGTLGTFLLSDQSTSPWSWECATGENAAFPKTGQNAIRFMGTHASLDFPNLVVWHHAGEQPSWNNPLQAKQMENTLADAYQLQLAHFAAVIRGEVEPRIDARDASDTLRATISVYEAAKTGRRITL